MFLCRRNKYFPLLPHDYKPAAPVVTKSPLKFTNSIYRTNDVEFVRLEEPIIYRLNEGNLLKCFASDSGWFAIFNMPNKDVTYLNSLLFDMVSARQITTGRIHYLAKGGEHTEYVGLDRRSRIFNRICLPINKTDYIGEFSGNVAIYINGILILSQHEIFIDASVYQVRIEQEDG